MGSWEMTDRGREVTDGGREVADEGREVTNVSRKLIYHGNKNKQSVFINVNLTANLLTAVSKVLSDYTTNSFIN